MAPNRETRQGIFWQEFICLWAISAALGLLELALIRMPSAVLARQLVVPIPSKLSALILIAKVVQGSIWLAIIIGAGLIIAHKMGMGAPLLEAWLRHQPAAQHLRKSLIPIGITIVVLISASLFSRASWFRPKRALDSAATEQLLKSPGIDGAMKELAQQGLAPDPDAIKPLTPLSETALHLNQAVVSELNGRLFETSAVILLLVQLFGRASSTKTRQIVWIAALFVGTLHTVENVIVAHENTVLIMQVFQKYGLPHDIPPFGLAFARTGVRVIPSAIALGLLYVSSGIEASFIASFCTIILSNFLTIFWLTHFSRA